MNHLHHLPSADDSFVQTEAGKEGRGGGGGGGGEGGLGWGGGGGVTRHCIQEMAMNAPVDAPLFTKYRQQFHSCSRIDRRGRG